MKMLLIVLLSLSNLAFADYEDNYSDPGDVVVIVAKHYAISIDYEGSLILAMSNTQAIGPTRVDNLQLIDCYRSEAGIMRLGYGSNGSFVAYSSGSKYSITSGCPLKVAKIVNILKRGKSAYLKFDNKNLVSIAEIVEL